MNYDTKITSAQHADLRHVLRPWTSNSYARPLIARGEGCWFWDHEGKRYLDMAAQRMYLALGHQHPGMVAALRRQAATLCTAASIYGSEVRSTAAALIAEVAPGGMEMVFFTTGGSEAVEHAIRMARLTTGRNKILSAYRSYHGSTAGSLSLTGDNRRLLTPEWSLPGVIHFFAPFLYRSHFNAVTESEECARALKHLEEVVLNEGPEHIAAILLETVVGRNGIIVPPDQYLPGVRALCDRYGILLILDEVMTGFGRCGEWFGADCWQIIPDLITFGKGVNSGYVPLGGVILGEAVADALAQGDGYPGGLTYSGHPLGCATAVASIEIFKEQHIIDHVNELAVKVFEPGLNELQDRHHCVGDIRGLGAFWAIELVKDRETREPLTDSDPSQPMTRLNAYCRHHGVWPFTHANRIHLVPPLVITEDELRFALGVIDEALTACDALTTS